MISIKVKNIKKVQQAFEKYGDEAVNSIDEVVADTAFELQQDAKLNAQSLSIYDKGDLIQNIFSEKQSEPLTYRVTSYMPYSAYHEFGTGTLVKIQSGWGQMAAYFKGKGIKEVNIKPRPFMYPAYVKAKSRFSKLIDKKIKLLNKKHNG